MAWNTHYLPPDPTLWQGRADTPKGSSFFQIVEPINLLEGKSLESTLSSFALLGFKCDEGIRRNQGRVGAEDGPRALRQALAKLPVQNLNFALFDVGNIVCADGDLESAQAALGEIVALLLENKIKPIVLGGGHETAWGHYQGIASVYKKQDLGIVNFDSHLDMRPLLKNDLGNSGTPFLQIAKAQEKAKKRFDYNCVGIQHAGNIRQLFETAKSYNTKIILADELHQGQLQKCVDFIDRVADENDIIYLSICLDVFGAPYAPGVSAVQPLGLSPWHVIPYVRQLASSGKVISYDIVELSPRYDIDQRTAKLGANLIYEIIHHHNDEAMPW